MKNDGRFWRLFWCLTVFSGILNAQSADDFVKAGWDAFDRNDFTAVESAFQAAIDLEPDHSRAHLGLYFLYSLQQKDNKIWDELDAVFSAVPDPYPYIFAIFNQPVLRQTLNQRKSPALALLKELSTSEDDAHGLVKAWAAELLGTHYLSRNKFKKAREYFQAGQFIQDWSVIGPFENISQSGFQKSFPPELGFSPDTVIPGKNDIPVKWFDIPEIRLDNWLDLTHYFDSRDAVFYGNTFVYSGSVQPVQIRIGTSGSLKAFLNDTEICRFPDENNNGIDTYIISTELQEGWNRLLVKCGYSEIQSCNFLVRITDEHGGPAAGLKYDTKAHEYSHQLEFPVSLVPNFAESAFLEKIQLHPDHLENYLLLAMVYLINDKAVEAEKILNRASEYLPGSALIPTHKMEALLRGEKVDEISTIQEQLFATVPTLPGPIFYKAADALNDEDYETVGRLIDQYESGWPDSKLLFNLKLQYLYAIEALPEVTQLLEYFYELYPDDVSIVRSYFIMQYSSTKDPDAGIKIMKKALKENYQAEYLNILAELHLADGNLDHFEKIMEANQELQPSNPEILTRFGSILYQIKEYDDAEDAVKQALKIRPQSSGLWELLGSIRRDSGNSDQAGDCYRNALMYRSTNYDAREALRQLEGKPDIFTRFKSLSADSLIAIAPGPEDYPEADAVVLMQDKHRVVYQGGASQSTEETIVRILNQNGLNAFTEFSFSFNPFLETLVVEKAQVVKTSGARIEGEMSSGMVVFKSLEVGDFIHLKWKTKNYYSGKLSNHFWDEMVFSSWNPVLYSSYELLAPESETFDYVTHHFQQDAVVEQTPDGLLYRWEIMDELAVRYEIGMPSLEQVGKVLQITSLPDWNYIVEWYSDLALNKARTSFEIEQQVADIFSDLSKPDLEQKIRRIHHYITENVTYSYVPFRQSGLVPQKARDVLVDKVGDCKDMATLAIAMLSEVDVEASYVLVRTRDEGHRPDDLPSIDFNHCIVKVPGIDDDDIFMDLTAQNFPVKTVPNMDMGAFSLLIESSSNAPMVLGEAGFLPRNSFRDTKISLTEDGLMSLTSQCRKTGALAAGFRSNYRFMAQSDRERNLTEYLAGLYPNIRLTEFEILDIDAIDPEIAYHYSYEVPDYTTDTGTFRFFRVPWADRLDSNNALSYDERRYPYQIWTMTDTMLQTIQITIPDGYEPVELTEKLKYVSEHLEYELTYSWQDGVIAARRQFISRKDEVSPEVYSEFKELYNKIVKADETQILLRKNN